jgi:tetratricopeptide (TPR) repeat protein
MYYVDQADVFARLDTEHANVRAVMEWALEPGRAELAGELVATFHIVWLARGQHFHETQQWLERVLEFRGQVSDPVWAQVLIAASDSRKISGDRAGVTQVAEELVRTMEGNPAVDPLTVASALADLADMAIEEGELERATALAKRSLAFREAHGLPGARALTSLGEIARLEGDLERAARSIETAAAEYRNSGFHVNYSSALVSLGEIACQRRDFDAAVAYLIEALAVQSRLGDQVGIGESLRSLALVARDQGRPVRAGRLWSAGTAILDSLGVQPSAQREAAKLEWHADAVGEGAAMSVEEAVEYALSSID